MRVSILESSDLTKPEELIMYKAVLNSVQFFDVIYDHTSKPTRLSYKVPYKSISTNRNTDPNETFRTDRDEENVSVEVNHRGGSLYDVLCQVEDILVGDTLGEDGGPSLGDINLQSIIFLEDILELN
jgi:hypothetical protein